MLETSKRLWEIEHPYYMHEGNYFSNGQHISWKSWQEFEADWSGTDLDYNWFVRWDWLEGEDWGAGEFSGDIYYRNGRFMLQLIGQRKGYLGSHEIAVCRADEPAIIEFLRPRWEYMQRMWEPFTLPTPPSIGEAKE